MLLQILNRIILKPLYRAYMAQKELTSNSVRNSKKFRN